MTKIKLKLLEVTKPRIILSNEKDKKEIIYTEEACKNLIKGTKNLQIPVFMFGQQAPCGRISDIWYEEDKKEVWVEIELFIRTAAGAQINKELETPQGKSILSMNLLNLQLVPDLNELELRMEQLEEKE